MKEVDVQSEIVKEARALRGHAFKCAHKFAAGVADLYIKLPAYPGTFIEVKMGTIANMRSAAFSNPCTELQKRFLRDERRAGGMSGWVLVIYKRGGTAILYPFADFESGTFDLTKEVPLYRMPGKRWPVMEIVSRICQT